MQKWEYRIVTFDKIGFTQTTIYDSGVDTIETKIKTAGGETPMNAVKIRADYLNKLGAEGWELVSFDGNFLLKRPLP